MPNFCHVTVAGRLTRDPETREVGGTSVTTYTVAVSEKFKTKAGEDRETVAYIDCESWGRQGEVIAQYVAKGDPLLVSGRLRQDNWEDKDGNKRSKLKVAVDKFEFLKSRSDSGSRSRPTADVGYDNDGDIPF